MAIHVRRRESWSRLSARRLRRSRRARNSQAGCGAFACDLSNPERMTAGNRAAVATMLRAITSKVVEAVDRPHAHSHRKSPYRARV